MTKKDGSHLKNEMRLLFAGVYIVGTGAFAYLLNAINNNPTLLNTIMTKLN